MKINGTTIVSPSSYKWGKFKLFSEDSGRMEDGSNFLNIITQKRKLYCSWRHRTQAEINTLMNLIDPDVAGTNIKPYTYLTIEYTDPLTGEASTGTFQTGDVEVEAMEMDPESLEVTDWVNLTANFILQ